MKKALYCILVIVFTVATFTSCGYNRIMRKYLSDPSNYRTTNVILSDVSIYDSESHTFVSCLNMADCIDQDVYFTVTFETYEDIELFIGGSPNTAYLPNEFVFNLVVFSENNKILYENGFYEDFTLGEKITISSSHFIYMDGEFFNVAMVERGGVVYLSFEEGLENIVDYMNENKSLL